MSSPDTTYASVYDDCPELYDLLYHRYLKSAGTFADLVARETRPGGPVLDAAAGTGSVTIPLLHAGFDVMSADASPGMLEVLRRKAEAAGLTARILVVPVESVDPGAFFATVCMRQAINYILGREALATTAAHIRSILEPGGAFIFNAPNLREGATYPDVENRYEVDGVRAYVLERNTVDGRMLTHRQDALVWTESDVRHVREANTFHLYTRNEFASALVDAGFVTVEFLSSRLGAYSESDPTLYCVARS